MQNIAWGWLAYEITNSAWWLGVLGFCGSIPALFLAPFSGALADRANKRRILVATQSVYMVLAFVLAWLVYSDQIKLWHLVTIALLNGVTFGIDAPVRQSYAPTLAGKENLMNAIGLNSMAFNTARILGPALAGMLLAKIGAGGCFLINGISFLAVLIALLNIRADGRPLNADLAHPLLGYLGEGFRYLSQQKDMLLLLILAAIVTIFGGQYNTLLPVFARNVFHGGPEVLGLLSSSIGCGALLGALGASQFHRLPQKGRIIAISCLGFATALIVFSQSSQLSLAYLALAFGGVSIVAYNTTNNMLVQTMSDECLRGRMVGIYMLTAIGLGPFGALLGGALAANYGARTAVTLGGAVCAGCMLLALLIRPSLLKIRAS